MYVGQGGNYKQWLVYKTHNDLYTSCTLYLYTSHTACVRCLCIPCNVYSMAMYTIRGNWTRRSGRENILMHNYSISSWEYLFSTFIHRKHMQRHNISLAKSSVWVVFCTRWQKLWLKEAFIWQLISMKRGPKKAHLKLRRHVNTEMYMCERDGKQQVIYNLVIYKLRLKQLVQWTHSHYNHQHHHCLSKVLSLFDYSRCYVVKTKQSFYPLSW